MTLKEYIVVKTPESEFEVWTRKTYENYIKGAVSVGAGSAYRVVTTFNADEQLTEPGQPMPAGEWFSVEKELPDFNQEVLVFGKRRLTQPTMDRNPPKVMLGYRQDLTDSSIPKRDWLRYADKNNFRMMEDVSHWRPLPAPPSLKQGDNQ